MTVYSVSVAPPSVRHKGALLHRNYSICDRKTVDVGKSGALMPCTRQYWHLKVEFINVR